jgi:signal transduction histidine kinase
MVLPFLADYCLIDEVRDDGKLRRVAAAHVNPSREGFFYTGAEHAYTASMSHHPTVQVFHTRRPVLVPEATEQVLDEISHSAEHRERLLRIGLCSFVIVPLIARDRALGTLTLAMADSERRYSEAELPLLEEVARRAAIALDNARLYGKEQQAVAAREQILAVVSHDLRNPLASLMIDASCITDGVDGVQVPEPILERAERISEGAEQMNRMIGDLLDAALIDAGRLRVHPGRCSLEGLLRTAVTRQRPLAEANRIRMGFVVDGEAEAVWADRERLLQLFSNLFANALRLTPPGGEVGVRATGAPDGCRFEVWDTGPGIAPEHRERIWEAHWQVPGERRRGGGGLGLAIARGIVEAHGGRIWVESTEGEGSRFFFTVPTLPREAGE